MKTVFFHFSCSDENLIESGFQEKAGCLLNSISVMAQIWTNEWHVFSKETMRYSSLMTLFFSQITEILTKFSFIF